MAIHHEAKVHALFVGYLGRPPTPSELSTWSAHLAANSNGPWLPSVATSLAGYLRSTDSYQADMALSNEDLVNTVFLRMTGSLPSTDLYSHFVDGLNDGTIQDGGLPVAILRDCGIMPKPDGSGGVTYGRPATSAGTDLTALVTASGTDYAGGVQNKIAASRSFDTALDTQAEIDEFSSNPAAAIDWMSSVNSDDASLTRAEGNVSEAMTEMARSASSGENLVESGSVSYAGDVDTVPVTLVAEHTYRIQVQAAAASQLDPQISGVRDTASIAIDDAANTDYGIGQNAQILYTPTVAGDYWVSVSGENSTTGDYVLYVTDLSAESAGESDTTVAAGESYSGSISESFSRDTVFFTLTAGQEYQFAVSASSSGNPLDAPVLRGIYDSLGKQLPGSYAESSGGSLTLTLTPASTGTYYAEIADTFDDTGAFTFSFQAVSKSMTAGRGFLVDSRTADDYAASTSTTGYVYAGSSATGSIETSGDSDWFAAYLYSGYQYTIDLRGSGSGYGTLYDPVINYIYDSSGTYISSTYSDDYSGRESQVTFTPPTTGYYYIAADAYSDYTGTYTLSVSSGTATTPSDDYAASTSTTGYVYSGDSITGNIETNGDNDWFYAYLYGGYAYQIDLRGADSSGGTLSDPVIDSVRDSSGTAISSTYDDDSGTGYDSLLSFTPTTSGYYYIVARSVGNSGTGTYTLSVSSGTSTTTTDSVPASTSTTASLSVGGSADVTINQAYDEDWYAISLTGGYTYQFTLTADSGNSTSYPVIYGVYDDSGSYVGGYGYGSSTDAASSTFTPASSGTYYVSAYSYYAGSYTLAAALSSAGDSIPAGTSTTASLSAGGSVSGTIDSAYDEDWYYAYLTAGSTYSIELRGQSSSGGTLYDTYLRGIYDSSGTLISGTTDDDSGTGTDSLLGFTPTATGYYYISAGGYSSYTGTYTLSLSQSSTDVSAWTDTGGTLSVGGSASVTIDQAYDEDWFAVSLTGGYAYQFTLTAGSGNSTSYPVIYGVYDSSGSYVGGYAYGSSTDAASSTFTPTSSGTYYVSAYSYYAGSYTLAAALSSAGDSIPAGTSTTASLSAGGSVSGTIDSAYDEDWFAISMTAGTTYTIDLLGQSSSGGTLYDPYLRGVYNGSGTLQSSSTDDDSGTGTDSQVEFTPTATGTYYISAGGYSSYTGTYTLSVSGTANAAGDSIPASVATTATVSVGGSASGTIDSAYDQDWYAVSLSSGYSYTINLRGSGSGFGTLEDPLIYYVYDSSGVAISGTYADDQDGRDAELTFTPAAGGTYYISAAAYGSYTGTYTLSVAQSVAEVSAWTDTSGTLSVGGSTDVTIDQAYDEDWFAVSLTGGSTYQFTLAAGSGNSTSYPVIYGVYDSSGSYVGGYAYGSSTDAATATFTPTSSGTYYVSTYSYYAGSYTLSAEQVASDVAASTATTGSVSVGGSVAGTVDSAYDEDWFAVALTAGTTYTVTLGGSDSGQGTLYDPLIGSLYDSSGNAVADTYADGSYDSSGNFSWLDAGLTFTPTTSGTYYISAGGYSSYTGTYTLAVSQAGTDIAASTATTGTVSVGGSVSGTIGSADDADWYAVSLTGGQGYAIRLQGSAYGNGTLSDPLISGIFDSSGTLVENTYADDQDGLDSRLAFTPTASGTYYIAAEGYGSSTGTFRLSVGQETSTDLAAATSTAGSVLANSSATSTIDTASDRDWFAVTLNAGYAYQIDLLGSHAGDGTLSDPYLYGLYDASGTLISGTTDDDSGDGLNSRLVYDNSTTGTYYISAGAYGSGTGTYALAVTRLGTTDLAASTATSGTVSPGGSASGLVDEINDRDWFAVTLATGFEYVINLDPSSNSSTPLNDPYLYGIYDATGTQVSGTTDDDSGPGYGSEITFAPSASGTYYVSAGGYGSNVGEYTLSVSNPRAVSGGTTVQADIAATAATTASLSVGGSAASSIDTASDQDWFSVSLSAGRSYSFALAGAASGGGTLGNPYLRGIYNGSGTLVSGTTDDDSGYGNDALVNFTPTTGGTYYVSAGAFSTGTGSYTLTLTENVSAGTGSTGGTPAGTGTAASGSWTVMVYVDGDNNLEEYALYDVNEMEAVGLPQNARVSVLVDRVPGYSNADGNWTGTRFGLVSQDSNLNAISSSLASWGERNMGSADTLTEFINASVQAAPAEHYALVIWDHGGGISGVSWDDSSFGANLSLREVSQAIAASNVQRFDMIGFDACLQGVLDQSYALRDQASYIVASEDLEPGDGWNYTSWLSIFSQQSSVSGEQLASRAVSTYAQSYAASGNNQVTLSAVETSDLGDLSSAWSSFAQSLVAAGPGAMQVFSSARDGSLAFQNRYVDLHSLMTQFMQSNSVASLDTAAQSVLTALGDAVVATGGLSGASGLTVYLPRTADSGYLNGTEFPIVGLNGVQSFYNAYWG